jgi:nickel/cobalt exporter
MSLGTAATTGALASMAVLTKKTAAKYSGAGSWKTLIAGRLFELAAAFAVLIFGLILLAATLSSAGVRAS